MSQATHDYFPDWMLMAYADGELEPHERDAIAAYVANDPAAHLRLAAFMRSGHALATLFDQPMSEPVPARLIETVRQAGRRAPSGESGLAARLAGLLTPYLLKPSPRLSWSGLWPIAMAVPAGVLAVALVVLASSHVDTGHEPGLTPQMRLALETAPSRPAGAIEALRSTVTPVVTFKTGPGQFCRQYVATAADGARVAGVGCRDPQGQWRIEAEAPYTGVTAQAAGGYSPAAGPSSSALDAAIDRLITGDPLSAGDEAALIARSWRSLP